MRGERMTDDEWMAEVEAAARAGRRSEENLRIERNLDAIRAMAERLKVDASDSLEAAVWLQWQGVLRPGRLPKDAVELEHLVTMALLGRVEAGQQLRRQREEAELRRVIAGALARAHRPAAEVFDRHYAEQRAQRAAEAAAESNRLAIIEAWNPYATDRLLPDPWPEFAPGCRQTKKTHTEDVGWSRMGVDFDFGDDP